MSSSERVGAGDRVPGSGVTGGGLTAITGEGRRGQPAIAGQSLFNERD